MDLPEGCARPVADASEPLHRQIAPVSLEALARRRAHSIIKNIEALIAEGGDITLGALPPHQCAAKTADGHNALAMLVRRDGESLDALLKLLDKAIGLAWSDDLFID